MPKYLMVGSYSVEGAKGLMKDGGSKRRQVAEAALKSVGGTVESFYFAFGEYDLCIILDVPDNVSIAAASLAISAGGGFHSKTIVLLTPEEIDQATKKTTSYTAPGR
jgi:uncharacterized protein with GYD domain